MVTTRNYLNDGANHQARAVLSFLSNREIEESWNGSEYLADVTVARWSNFREQGYVLSLRIPDYENNEINQLNIAFFEHRISDSICAVLWKQYLRNAPTIDTAKFDNKYKDCYDLSKEVDYGQIYEMSNWIWNRLTDFWVENSK